jgi:hypothetical protein
MALLIRTNTYRVIRLGYCNLSPSILHDVSAVFYFVLCYLLWRDISSIDSCKGIRGSGPTDTNEATGGWAKQSSHGRLLSSLISVPKTSDVIGYTICLIFCWYFVFVLCQTFFGFMTHFWFQYNLHYIDYTYTSVALKCKENVDTLRSNWNSKYSH